MSEQTRYGCVIVRALIAALAVPVAAPVYAQQSVIEEIVVTSRKREESLQDVPVAVTALDADLVARQALENVADVSRYMPNVYLGDGQFTAGQLAASIRGTQFAEVEKSFESSVGVIIDGMFLGTGTGASVQMLDVEQVEVLRGPQGTLYGRNTIGGTINFRRTRPTGEFGYKLNARFGENDRQNFGIVLNLPAFASISTKLYAFTKEADLAADLEGYGSEDGQDWLSLGTSLLWEPTDTFSAQLTLDYVDDDSNYERQYDLTLSADQSAAVGVVPEEIPLVTTCDIFGPGTDVNDPSACYAGNFVVQQADDFETSFGDPAFPFESSMENWSAILEINNDMANDITMTSITAYMDMDDKLIEPNVGARPLVPGVVYDYFWAERDQDYFQFSQELRFASNFSSPVNFVAGVYYLRSQYELDGDGPPPVPPTATTPGSPSPSIFLAGTPAGIFRSKQDVDALAVFGELYWDVTERLRLTGGLRYSYETKNFFMDRWIVDDLGDVVPQFTFDDDDNWDEPTWRLIADYTFTDGIMGYASYAKGFRSGGFDGRATTLVQLQQPFDPETVDTYEIGARMDLWGNRLRLNPTVFYTTYDDKQEERLFAFIPEGGSVPETVTVTVNAAEATIWGVELETVFAATDNLQFRGALGYLDAEYDKFEAFNAITEEFQDISDTARLRRAPEWTYSVGADYYLTLGPGQLITSIHHSYTDEFFSSPVQFQEDPLGRDIGPDDYRTDIFVTYDMPIRDDGTTLTATVFMKDAFGNDVRRTGAVSAGLFWFGQRAAERQWGVELTLKH